MIVEVFTSSWWHKMFDFYYPTLLGGVTLSNPLLRDQGWPTERLYVWVRFQPSPFSDLLSFHLHSSVDVVTLGLFKVVFLRREVKPSNESNHKCTYQTSTHTLFLDTHKQSRTIASLICVLYIILIDYNWFMIKRHGGSNWHLGNCSLRMGSWYISDLYIHASSRSRCRKQPFAIKNMTALWWSAKTTSLLHFSGATFSFSLSHSSLVHTKQHLDPVLSALGLLSHYHRGSP